MLLITVLIVASICTAERLYPNNFEDGIISITVPSNDYYDFEPKKVSNVPRTTEKTKSSKYFTPSPSSQWEPFSPQPLPKRRLKHKSIRGTRDFAKNRRYVTSDEIRSQRNKVLDFIGLRKNIQDSEQYSSTIDQQNPYEYIPPNLNEDFQRRIKPFQYHNQVTTLSKKPSKVSRTTSQEYSNVLPTYLPQIETSSIPIQQVTPTADVQGFFLPSQLETAPQNKDIDVNIINKPSTFYMGGIYTTSINLPIYTTDSPKLDTLVIAPNYTNYLPPFEGNIGTLEYLQPFEKTFENYPAVPSSSPETPIDIQRHNDQMLIIPQNVPEIVQIPSTESPQTTQVQEYIQERAINISASRRSDTGYFGDPTSIQWNPQNNYAFTQRLSNITLRPIKQYNMEHTHFASAPVNNNPKHLISRSSIDQKPSQTDALQFDVNQPSYNAINSESNQLAMSEQSMPYGTKLPQQDIQYYPATEMYNNQMAINNLEQNRNMESIGGLTQTPARKDMRQPIELIGPKQYEQYRQEHQMQQQQNQINERSFSQHPSSSGIHSVVTEEIPILKQTSEIAHDGSFHYETLTGDQTHVIQEGHIENPGTDNEEQVIHGSYSFVGGDGITYTVNYVADANGFRASGEHLPTPPPIPEVIQRSVELNLIAEANKATEAQSQPQQIGSANNQNNHGNLQDQNRRSPQLNSNRRNNNFQNTGQPNDQNNNKNYAGYHTLEPRNDNGLIDYGLSATNNNPGINAYQSDNNKIETDVRYNHQNDNNKHQSAQNNVNLNTPDYQNLQGNYGYLQDQHVSNNNHYYVTQDSNEKNVDQNNIVQQPNFNSNQNYQSTQGYQYDNNQYQYMNNNNQGYQTPQGSMNINPGYFEYQNSATTNNKELENGILMNSNDGQFHDQTVPVNYNNQWINNNTGSSQPTNLNSGMPYIY